MWNKSFTLLLIIFCYPSIVSCIGQDNGPGPTSLRWHENIKLDTILGWKITELIPLDATIQVKIGEIRIQQSDVVQIGFVKNPPVKAREFFGLEYLVYNFNPPIWVNLFVTSIRIDLDLAQFDLEMNKGEDFSYLQLFSLPIEYKFRNGSSASLEYFLDEFGKMFDYYNYTVGNNGYSFLVEWSTGLDINQSSYSYTISPLTGVTTRFSWNTSTYRMVWNYLDEAANFKLDGTLGKIESHYSVKLNYPITIPWEIVLLIFIILVPLGLLILRKAIEQLEKLLPFEELENFEDEINSSQSMEE
ncbi:MAG: hypothetical protein ACFFDC_16650 [Promethearchaeota archaeon]